MIYILLCLSLILMVGCGKSKKNSEATTTHTENTRKKSSKGNTETVDEITVDGMAADALKQMSLEEKVGQLFIVCTDSLDFSADTAMTDQMKENLQKYQPGGVIFFSFNLENRDQTTAFIQSMQQNVKIPLFIGVDEEGGKVARIGNHKNMGTKSFPTMKEIGETGDYTLATELGKTIGKEIYALGFNLDFAPVVDVTTPEMNQEIGERSFGDNPDLVAGMAIEVIKGLQKNNVSATIKHFPGQGRSTEDTHKGFVDMDVSIDELRKTDFVPFKKCIAADVDFVMVSHVAMKSVTGDDLPCSLSQIVVSDILREELRFEKVIITDAMNMKCITKFYDSDAAAILALKAGNDMILMPDDFELAVNGILDAVVEGKISEETIDEAVTRILKVKIQRHILTENNPIYE